MTTGIISLCLDHDLLGRLGLHIDQRMDKSLNNLSTSLVASILDFLELHLSLLVRILLGLLVSARVLETVMSTLTFVQMSHLPTSTPQDR